MTQTYTQDNDKAWLATPLGKDKLLLASFEAVEAMGELFEIRVEAQSTDSSIDFDQVLGRNCSVHFDTNDGAGRDLAPIEG